jgi:flagellar hook protein FlgE
MNSSFYNGISGMKTHQFGIDVWSDNIAGINTVGFKASTPEFSSIFNTQLANSYFDPAFSDVGLGSTAQAVSTNFDFGTTVEAEGKYDMAINGDGWFGVVDQNGEKFYTRAGAFQRDKDGYLVDNTGNYVTGTSANNFADGIVVDEPKSPVQLDNVKEQSKILIPEQLTIPSSPTTKVDFSGSLNADIITKFSALTGKEEEVANIEVYRTNIFDEQGNENALEIILTKVVPQAETGMTWNAKATLTDKDKNPLSSQEGQLKFNARGAIISNTLDSIDNNGSPTSLKFGTFYDPNIANSGFDGLVSLSGFVSERVTTKDGYKQGNLQDYSINADGTIIASFDNGQSLPISRIAIYNFQNNKGLENTNPIYFKESANSGNARFLTDKDGNYIQNASISTNRLEMSNIDISTALTELLVMQKAFDANSKSITTSDQMIQNAINMKK